MGSLRRSALAAAAVLLALLRAAPAAAQVVQGTVVDARTEAALQGVNVALLDAAGARAAITVTDAQGAFLLRVPREGSFRITASRVGYATSSTDLGMVGGRVSLTLPIRLASAAIEMGPLVVTAEAPRFPPDPRLAPTGFNERRERGPGVFWTREQLLASNPARMSALGYVLPGVRPVPAGYSGGGDVVMHRSGCLPSIWIDWRLARPGGLRLVGHSPGRPTTHDSRRAQPSPPQGPSLDELVTPTEVEGLEVYRSASEVPATFTSSSDCGALVIWLRQAPESDEMRDGRVSREQ